MASTIKVRPYTRNGKVLGWRADLHVTLPEGERIRERPVLRGISKTEAQEWAQRRVRALFDPLQRKREQEQEAAETAPTIATFKDAFIEFEQANRRKASTVYAKGSIYDHHLIPLFGSRRVDEITTADGEAVKARLKECDRKTVNNVLTVLSTALKVAQKLGHIPEDRKIPHFDRIKVKYDDAIRPDQFYDFEQYGKLLHACARLDPRIRAAVLASADAGLRPGEVVGLEWPDLGKTPPVLRVERQVWNGPTQGSGPIVDTPKGGVGRVIPLTTRLAAALAALPVRHLDGVRVFVQDDGKAITTKVLRGWMKTAQRAAGLRVNGNVKMLRHTFASHLAMRGAPALVIQRLCGHVHLSTTTRYMHLAGGELDRAIGLLESTAPADSTAAVATMRHTEP